MKLHDTKWLSEQLSLSISTIEKLRSEQPDQLPKAIIINKTIRYCELHVHWWLQHRLHPGIPDFDTWLKEYYEQQRIVLKRPKANVTNVANTANATSKTSLEQSQQESAQLTIPTPL